jgi:hypothetical protein
MDQELYNRIVSAPSGPPMSTTISGDLTNADLRDRDLRQFQFSNVDFRGAALDGCIFHRVIECRFEGACLAGIRVQSDPLSSNSGSMFKCDFRGVNLHGLDLSRVNLRESDFSNANLIGCNLEQTYLEGCKFYNADVRNSWVKRAHVSAEFLWAKNVPFVKHLDAVVPVNISSDDLAVLHLKPAERWASWRMIRTIGQLPLFGLSSATVAGVLIFFGFVSIYNYFVDKLNNLAYQPSGKPVAQVLYPYSIGVLDWPIPVAALLLAIASAIYLAKCPPRIKENTITYWTDVIGREALHYMALAWESRYWRVVCGIFYVIGGALGLTGVLYKLTRVFMFMWQNTVF